MNNDDWDDMLLELFADDKTILMIGPKGNGKTNAASVFMNSLINLDYEIWTNIHFFKYENIPLAIKKKKLPMIKGHKYIEKPPQIHVVKSLSETLLGIINSGPRGKAVFLDEAGIHASSSRATSKETVNIKDLNKIIRHFESCFVLLAQVKGDVPPALREKDCDYHLKMNKKHGKYFVNVGIKNEVEDPETGESRIDYPFVDTFLVPLSRFPCDGKFPTGFYIDINLREALNRLSDVEDSVEIMDKGIGEKILREIMEDNKPKKNISKKELIMNEFYSKSNISMRGLAKKYNTSYQNVKNIHADFLRDNNNF